MSAQSESTALAISQHKEGCRIERESKITNIWKSINNLVHDLGELTNDKQTGQVDQLWQEREARMKDDKNNRRYWGRLIFGYLILQGISGVVFLVMLSGKIKALLAVAGIQ